MEVGHVYLKVGTDEIIIDDFEALAYRLEQRAIPIAIRVFGRGVTVAYDLEEGTLREHIKILATLWLIIQGIASYHNLRTSIIDLYHDAESFAREAIDEFHQITGTKTNDIISQRVTPRDMARLYRIIQNADELATEWSPVPEAVQIRDQIITDLGALCRAYPDDPGLAVLIKALPKGRKAPLPDTPAEAIAEDDLLRERRRKLVSKPPTELPREPVAQRPFRRRRRYRHITHL